MDTNNPPEATEFLSRVKSHFTSQHKGKRKIYYCVEVGIPDLGVRTINKEYSDFEVLFKVLRDKALLKDTREFSFPLISFLVSELDRQKNVNTFCEILNGLKPLPPDVYEFFFPEKQELLSFLQKFSLDRYERFFLHTLGIWEPKNFACCTAKDWMTIRGELKDAEYYRLVTALNVDVLVKGIHLESYQHLFHPTSTKIFDFRKTLGDLKWKELKSKLRKHELKRLKKALDDFPLELQIKPLSHPTNKQEIEQFYEDHKAVFRAELGLVDWTEFSFVNFEENGTLQHIDQTDVQKIRNLISCELVQVSPDSVLDSCSNCSTKCLGDQDFLNSRRINGSKRIRMLKERMSTFLESLKIEQHLDTYFLNQFGIASPAEFKDLKSEDWEQMELDNALDISSITRLKNSLDLITAVVEGDLERTKSLIEAGTDINTCDFDDDNDGYTALIWAALLNHEEMCKYLLQHEANMEWRTRDGWTALQVAACLGHSVVCYQLLQHKAQADLTTNYGITALQAAACLGHVNVCQYLLDYKANTNLTTKDGWTALQRAARNGKDGCLNLLLKAGADVNQQDNTGATALHEASRNGRTGCLVLLLEAQADANQKDNSGATALLEASDSGMADCLDLLLQAGAEINQQDNSGATALHKASQEGCDRCVDFLLRARANPNIQDKDGHTALDRAIELNRDGCLRLLQSGADFNHEHNEVAVAQIQASNKEESILSRNPEQDDTKTSPDLSQVLNYDQYVASMRHKGYEIHEMNGDGHCLYHAVCHQLSQEKTHHSLRQEIANYIKINWDSTFKEFSLTGLEETVTHILGTGWGDHLEIRAIELLYQRPVEIFSAESPNLKPAKIDFGSGEEESEYNAEPIRLSYRNRSHYDAVVPINKKHSVQSPQINRLQDCNAHQQMKIEHERLQIIVPRPKEFGIEFKKTCDQVKIDNINFYIASWEIKTKLRQDDEIVSINASSVKSTCEAQALMEAIGLGKPLILEIQRRLFPDWQWCDTKGDWHSYLSGMQEKIETAFQTNENKVIIECVSYKDSGLKTYIININNLTQSHVCGNSGHTVNIRRILTQQIPDWQWCDTNEHWNSYLPDVQRTIEAAFQTKEKEVQIECMSFKDSQRKTYRINIINLSQSNIGTNSGKNVKIQRALAQKTETKFEWRWWHAETSQWGEYEPVNRNLIEHAYKKRVHCNVTVLTGETYLIDTEKLVQKNEKRGTEREIRRF